LADLTRVKPIGCVFLRF